MSEPVKSPCISVCVLNEEDICEGCYRSAQEITDWSTRSDEQKREILARAKRRFHRLNRYPLL